MKRSQRCIEGVPHEVVDTLVGEIRKAEVSREKRCEQPVEDCTQRFARRHFEDRLVAVATVAGFSAGLAQLRDDPINAPQQARTAVASVFVDAHAAIPSVRETPSNSAVLRYRSPESGSTTTMVLPAFDGRLAIRAATATAAPHEMPDRIPSSRVSRRA